jgi:hypothetical protein
VAFSPMVTSPEPWRDARGLDRAGSGLMPGLLQVYAHCLPGNRRRSGYASEPQCATGHMAENHPYSQIAPGRRTAGGDPMDARTRATHVTTETSDMCLDERAAVPGRLQLIESQGPGAQSLATEAEHRNAAPARPRPGFEGVSSGSNVQRSSSCRRPPVLVRGPAVVGSRQAGSETSAEPLP